MQMAAKSGPAVLDIRVQQLRGASRGIPQLDIPASGQFHAHVAWGAIATGGADEQPAAVAVAAQLMHQISDLHALI